MTNSANSSPRILFLSLSGIGNYLMQTPAIAAVKKKYPTSHITVWVAPRGTKPLAQNDPNVDEVIEMPIQASGTQHLRQVLTIRQKQFDIGIVLSPGQLVKSAAYLYLAGIPRRVGAAYPFRSSPHSDFLLTDAVVEKEHVHDIEQNLHLLGPLGIQLERQNYALEVSKTNRDEAEVLMQKLALPAGQVVIGLHAGSAPDLAFKRWPIERFAEVAKALIRQHQAHILLFGGPDEEAQKKQLQHLIGERPVTLVSASLLTTAAVMQRCRLMISNDSGLMHLASAVGVETVGLFGPTSEVATGPRGSKVHVLRAPGTKPLYTTESGVDFGTGSHETILALSSQEVLTYATQLLASR